MQSTTRCHAISVPDCRWKIVGATAHEAGPSSSVIAAADSTGQIRCHISIVLLVTCRVASLIVPQQNCRYHGG